MRKFLILPFLVTFLLGCGSIPTKSVKTRPVNVVQTTTTTDPQIAHFYKYLQNEAQWYKWASKLPAPTTTTTVPVQYPHTPAPYIEPTPPAVPVPPIERVHVTQVIPDDLVAFFECVINHESAKSGVYLAVQPGGKYRGAYQMDYNFWVTYAPVEYRYMGDRQEWQLAPDTVQDAAALAGYQARGSNPWNGSGC